MTDVTGRPRRPLALDSFADLTGCGATSMVQNDDRTVTLSFFCELDADVAQAVWERLTSEDDADAEERRTVRALVADVQALTDADPESDNPLRRLLMALAARSLSEPPPIVPVATPEPDEEPATWQLPTL